RDAAQCETTEPGDGMRSRPSVLLLAVALVASQTGCGTMVNLTSPPPSQAEGGIGPTACTPFGGVTRSALLGGFCLTCGVAGAVEDIGQGTAVTGIGAFALLIDTPLSLAGDVVTLPIAFARSQEAPWATWWGDQGRNAAESPEGTGSGRW